MSEISSQQFPEAAAKPKAWLVQIRDTGFLSTADIATTNPNFDRAPNVKY